MTYRKKALESPFPKLSTFATSAEPSSRNHYMNMTKNRHVYATSGRPEVAGDVKTVKRYTTVNFEVSS